MYLIGRFRMIHTVLRNNPVKGRKRGIPFSIRKLRNWRFMPDKDSGGHFAGESSRLGWTISKG